MARYVKFHEAAAYVRDHIDWSQAGSPENFILRKINKGAIRPASENSVAWSSIGKNDNWAIWLAVCRTKIDLDQLQIQQKTRRGAPDKWDWCSINREIIRIADKDGLPDKQAGLVKLILDWCEQEWGKAPSESQLRERITSKLDKYRRSP